MADIKVKLYNWQGKASGEELLAPEVFGLEVKPEVVHQVVVAQQKNSREVLAHTKGRSEVRGGGKKPWRQKGTGQARHGSIRSPLWAGGGITFGPTSSRNYSVRVNKKLKKQALAMVLSDKVVNDKLVLVESYEMPEHKTKMLKTSLDKLPIKSKKTLIVTKTASDNIVKAAKNLPRVSTINFASLNVVDILNNEYLLVNKDLLNKIKEHYS